MTSVLLIDNYDSFAHNLAHCLAQAGAQVTVVRNDKLTREEIVALAPDAMVLSPGPGSPDRPADFGVCQDLIENPLDVPMLGVCLGMQGMAHFTGGKVLGAPEIVHGRATPFPHGEHQIFDGMEAEILVGRYHSLCVEASSLPAAWQPLGASADGTLMAMAHVDRPWIGLQFHPESILTPDGPKMMANFLAMIQ